MAVAKEYDKFTMVTRVKSRTGDILLLTACAGFPVEVLPFPSNYLIYYTRSRLRPLMNHAPSQKFHWDINNGGSLYASRHAMYTLIRFRDWLGFGV